MAWYYGTFSCGHEGRVNVIGPHKNRQWIIDKKFSGLCEECYAKYLEEKRIKENEEAKEKAEEMELPELTGTEKQVKWAITLRQKLIEKFEEYIEEINPEISSKRINVTNRVLAYILENENKASFYIDTRFALIESLVDNFEEISREEIIAEKAEEERLIEEGTVRPTEQKFNSVAVIKATTTSITVKFEKNETFRNIVKKLRYSFKNGVWERDINELTGSYIDRTAELGNTLLNNGFSISITDEEIRQKAINGEYEQECNRWILHHRKENKLAIKWYERNNDLYKSAKILPGARWKDGYMLVNVSNYKEVKDFAELFGFKFTDLAIEFIENYKEELKNVDVVTPTKVEIKKEDKNGLKDILNSSREIIDDLMEEE